MKFAKTPEDVTRVADTAITAADEIAEGLIAATERTWDTTMAPMEGVADLLSKAFAEGPFMGYVHPDEAVREEARIQEERLQQWAVEVVFRDDLYRAVSEYAATTEAGELTGEKARLLEFIERDLRHAGHELDPDTRAEVKKLTQRLVELGVQFEQNIAEHEDFLLVTEEDLTGMPGAYVEGLTEGDEEGTFKVTMAYPDVVPFMDNAVRRDLREQLSFKFNTRAVENNRPILEEAVRLRARIADLFEQPSWAHHQLEERMAKTPEAVLDFYADLVPPLTEAAREEVAELQQMLRVEIDDPDARLEPWDFRYYHTRMSKERHGVDPSEVAEYFPLESVLEGMFAITGEVFGIDYKPVELDTWHEDVRSYEVYDRADESFIATVHMDLFPRQGKFSHAAAFPLVPGRRLADGSYQHPTAAIVANLTKATDKRPSLLKHSEVETLFHEFGHILHQVLTKAELVRFAGSATERDFVEAPSQIMEHWTWRPEVLETFARHHESGEPIPTDLVEAMIRARNLDVASLNLRQVQYGTLDMDLHGPGAADADLDEIHQRATALTLMPLHEGTFFPASFGHMLGGYDAGYYGYLWSEVYGDDMFSRFETEGVTSPAVGSAYRKAILEAGGSQDGMDLLRAFLGRDPNNEAFLRKLGIDQN